jgi:hypothetical protein
MRLKFSASSWRWRPRSKLSWLAGGLFCCLLLRGAVQAAQTNTNQAPARAAIPQSIFVTEGTTGKDPFFPYSTRRFRKIETSKPAEVRDYRSLLKLTGIAGGVRPIATINNRTFAVEEEQDVPVEGGKVKIRVLEIREKSVVVLVEKQALPIELKLRDVNLKFGE